MVEFESLIDSFFQRCIINLNFYVKHLSYRFSFKFAPIGVASLIICCTLWCKGLNRDGQVSEETWHILFTVDNDLHCVQDSVHLLNLY